MDANQLKEIVQSGENQEVEFKESFHSQQKICQILCGLGNTNGGLIFFGVSDKGEFKGINGNSDELQRKIASANQCLSPTPVISIKSHKIEN